MTNPNRRPDATSRLEEALARIRSPEHEGSKVFTAVYEESARREAEASDRRRAAGTMRGPLDGRIVSIKALFDLAGEPTSAGSALLRRRPPAAVGRTRPRASARGRRRHHRQDSDDGVRLLGPRHQSPRSRAGQSARPHPSPGRVLLGRRCLRGRRHGRNRDRQRHRRLHSHPGCFVGRGRVQADRRPHSRPPAPSPCHRASTRSARSP